MTLAWPSLIYVNLVLILVAQFSGALLLYLGHAHQNWLARPLGTLWRWLGVTLLLASLIGACSLFPVNTSICAYSLGLMLWWGLLPFCPLLRNSLLIWKKSTCEH